MGKHIWEFAKTVVVAVVIALVVTTFIKPTLVKGYSMYPTIEPNNYILINKVPYLIGDPNYGDIVVFKSHVFSENEEEMDLIKRVVGIEGDEIKIAAGKVYRNGEKLNEKYLDFGINSGDDLAPIIVPPGCVFVMGDNRPISLDSRDPAVGMVSKTDILGRADLRLYPFDEIGTVNKVKE